MRAQPTCFGGWHRRADAECPGLVRCRGHHSPGRRAADDDRGTFEAGVEQDLNRGVERIKVGVQDRVCPAGSAGQGHVLVRRSGCGVPAAGTRTPFSKEVGRAPEGAHGDLLTPDARQSHTLCKASARELAPLLSPALARRAGRGAGPPVQFRRHRSCTSIGSFITS